MGAKGEGGELPIKNVTFCCSFIIGCAALVCVGVCLHRHTFVCCSRKQRLLMDGGSQRGEGVEEEERG